MNRIYDNGRLVQIQEDGEIVWTEENTLTRTKISDKSRSELVKEIEQIKGEHARKTCEKMFEILTGKTVKEAKE